MHTHMHTTHIHTCMHTLTCNTNIHTHFARIQQKFVDILEKLETENKLLHFAEHGQIKKRDGQRGDSQAQRKPKKNEL